MRVQRINFATALLRARKVRAGRLDVHPTEQALVVHYELEAAILGERMATVLSDKKECQKIIRLKSLNSSTDIAALVRELVEKCSLIHRSKLAEVEQLIYYLQQRRSGLPHGGSYTSQRPQTAAAPVVMGEALAASTSSLPSPEATAVEAASIANLEDYVELLYENIPEKRVLGALARVLREDWKRSLKLSTNIVYIFFCFSTFTLYPVITQRKVGYRTWDNEIKIAGVISSQGSPENPIFKTGQYRTAWKQRPLPSDGERYYNFTELACQLNEPEEGVAPSDSRHRPDQRLMENGMWDEANAEKLRLEEKQRTARRLREAEAEKAAEEGRPFPPYDPIWFRKEKEKSTGLVGYMYQGQYWECKERQDWRRCPDIF